MALSVDTTTVSEHRKNSCWPDDITAGGGEFESPEENSRMTSRVLFNEH